MQIIIGLGANLGDKEKNIEIACLEMEKQIGQILKRSTLYDSEPLVLPGEDPSNVPAYLNGVVLVESSLSPVLILEKLQGIERLCGRDRSKETIRWQSRLMDLDLIAIEDLVIQLPNLQVPHSEMHKRKFVLEPLMEVMPNWQHPLLGKSVVELLAVL